MARLHRVARFVAPIALGMFALPACAHSSLVSSTPTDKSQVFAPATIELTFSETLVPQFSTARLIMPGMPNHEAIQSHIQISGAGDGKTMVITPARPLHAGNYRVEWRAVSSDTHPITGNITFQVK